MIDDQAILEDKVKQVVLLVKFMDLYQATFDFQEWVLGAFEGKEITLAVGYVKTLHGYVCDCILRHNVCFAWTMN